MNKISNLTKFGCGVIFSIIIAWLVGGCNEYQLERFGLELTEIKLQTAAAIDAVDRGGTGDSDTLSILKVLQSTNTASSPMNPFALPIGIGLASIITMLEALRRKEKDGRKHAEQKLNNGNNKNGN